MYLTSAGKEALATVTDGIYQSHVGMFTSFDFVIFLTAQVAQRHGLFVAAEGYALDMALFEAVPDLEMRWKAWSRVESAKRCVSFLV